MCKNDLRPVMIFDSDGSEYSTGLFHCWAGTSEHAYALIELPSGRIFRVDPNYFLFTDRERVNPIPEQTELGES